MMITFAEAAKIARVSKGAIRKAALETRKLRADRDEHGVWRVDVSDVQRIWPQRLTPDTLTTHTPVSDGDSHSSTGVIRALEAQLEAAQRRIADKDDVIADLRRRLDTEGEERRRLTSLLTDQSPPPRNRRWWRLWLL